MSHSALSVSCHKTHGQGACDELNILQIASSTCSIFSYCFFVVTRLQQELSLQHPLIMKHLQTAGCRHLLQVQTNRDRASLLWALLFTIMAACCSQGNPNVNNQYLKRHKTFPWEAGKFAEDLTWPFLNASVLYSLSFWVTDAIPFQGLAWEIVWIWSCWPETAYLAGWDFLALLMILYSRSREGVLVNQTPCA